MSKKQSKALWVGAGILSLLLFNPVASVFADTGDNGQEPPKTQQQKPPPNEAYKRILNNWNSFTAEKQIDTIKIGIDSCLSAPNPDRRSCATWSDIVYIAAENHAYKTADVEYTMAWAFTGMGLKFKNVAADSLAIVKGIHDNPKFEENREKIAPFLPYFKGEAAPKPPTQ